MLSGQEDVEVAVSSVESGAYDYVVKNRSAFLRVQNDIKRIAAHRAKKQENKKLRNFIIFLSILLALLAFVSLIFTIDNTFFGLLG
jgi:DNA-binding NtrC family response regulator